MSTLTTAPAATATATSETSTPTPLQLPKQPLLSVSLRGAVSASLLWIAFLPVDTLWVRLIAVIAPVGWLLTIHDPRHVMHRAYGCLYLTRLVGLLALWSVPPVGSGLMPLSTLLTLLVIANDVPICVALSRVGVRGLKLPGVLVVPVVWVALEHLRSHAFGGFGLAMLGHTQGEGQAFAVIAQFGGTPLVSATLIAMANCIAEVVWIAWVFRQGAMDQLKTKSGADDHLGKTDTPMRSAMIRIAQSRGPIREQTDRSFKQALNRAASRDWQQEIGTPAFFLALLVLVTIVTEQGLGRTTFLRWLEDRPPLVAMIEARTDDPAAPARESPRVLFIHGSSQTEDVANFNQLRQRMGVKDLATLIRYQAPDARATSLGVMVGRGSESPRLFQSPTQFVKWKGIPLWASIDLDAEATMLAPIFGSSTDGFVPMVSTGKNLEIEIVDLLDRLRRSGIRPELVSLFVFLDPENASVYCAGALQRAALSMAALSTGKSAMLIRPDGRGEIFNGEGHYVRTLTAKSAPFDFPAYLGYRRPLPKSIQGWVGPACSLLAIPLFLQGAWAQRPRRSRQEAS